MYPPSPINLSAFPSVHSLDSLPKPSLPDKLDRAFRFSLLPLNHDPLTIKVAPRKVLGSDQGVPDAAVIAMLTGLASGEYLTQPKVDAQGWTFTCTPRVQHDHSCLILRTDRLHNLEWIEKKADEKQELRVEFAEPQPLPSPFSLNRSKRCPKSLEEAYISTSLQKQQIDEQKQELAQLSGNPILEDHSIVPLAAYEYLCDLIGAPITDEDHLYALLKAQNYLMKVHGGEFKMEIANIKEDGNKRKRPEVYLQSEVQRDMGKSMACIWFEEEFDEWGAIPLPEEFAEEIKKCMPPDLIENLMRYEPDIEKAHELALNIATIIFNWISDTSAVNCHEIAMTIFHLFHSVLEEDEEIEMKRVAAPNEHVRVEYMKKGTPFSVDGWTGRWNNRTAALTEHAYGMPLSEQLDADIRCDGKTKSWAKLADNIQELFDTLRSNTIILNNLRTISMFMMNELEKLRSNGRIFDGGDFFMPPPVLKGSFRAEARKVSQSLQERNTINFELKALHRAAGQTGLQAKPSTFSATVRASKNLMEKIWVDYAEEFAQHVTSLEKIDASNAHEVVDKWLNSSEFKLWEVLDVAKGKEALLLERLTEAFQNMDKDQALPALEQLWEQLPFLLTRYFDDFFPEIVNMAFRLVLFLEGQFGQRPETIIASEQLVVVLNEKAKELINATEDGAEIEIAQETANLLMKIMWLQNEADESDE